MEMRAARVSVVDWGVVMVGGPGWLSCMAAGAGLGCKLVAWGSGSIRL